MPVPRLPLVLTSDPDLLDDLLRLAAAGGSEVDVAADPAAARPRFAAAPLVVIGLDQLDSCHRARLPRRTQVFLVSRGPASKADEVKAAELGVDRLVALPMAEPWLVDRFAERFDPATRGRILAVIGGRGGAGASILSGGLAVTAVRAGHRTLLVDGDPLGGGLDLLLGWENGTACAGPRWPTRTAGSIRPPCSRPCRSAAIWCCSRSTASSFHPCRARRWRRPSTRAGAAAT